MASSEQVFSFAVGRAARLIDKFSSDLVEKGSDICVLPDDCFNFCVGVWKNKLIVKREMILLPSKVPRLIFCTLSITYFNRLHNHIVLLEFDLKSHTVTFFDPVNFRHPTNLKGSANVVEQIKKVLKEKYGFDRVFKRVTTKTQTLFKNSCESLALQTLARRIAGKVPPIMVLMYHELAKIKKFRSERYGLAAATNLMKAEMLNVRNEVAKVNKMTVEELIEEAMEQN